MLCNVMLLPQIEPGQVLQRIAQHLQASGRDQGTSEGEGLGLEVREVVTATRVPVLKLFDTGSQLEVSPPPPHTVTHAHIHSVTPHVTLDLCWRISHTGGHLRQQFLSSEEHGAAATVQSIAASLPLPRAGGEGLGQSEGLWGSAQRHADVVCLESFGGLLLD